jgi:hypothetical protein
MSTTRAAVYLKFEERVVNRKYTRSLPPVRCCKNEDKMRYPEGQLGGEEAETKSRSKPSPSPRHVIHPRPPNAEPPSPRAVLPFAKTSHRPDCTSIPPPRLFANTLQANDYLSRSLSSLVLFLCVSCNHFPLVHSLTTEPPSLLSIPHHHLNIFYLPARAEQITPSMVFQLAADLRTLRDYHHRPRTCQPYFRRWTRS